MQASIGRSLSEQTMALAFPSGSPKPCSGSSLRESCSLVRARFGPSRVAYSGAFALKRLAQGFANVPLPAILMLSVMLRVEVTDAELWLDNKFFWLARSSGTIHITFIEGSGCGNKM